MDNVITVFVSPKGSHKYSVTRLLIFTRTGQDVVPTVESVRTKLSGTPLLSVIDAFRRRVFCYRQRKISFDKSVCFVWTPQPYLFCWNSTAYVWTLRFLATAQTTHGRGWQSVDGLANESFAENIVEVSWGTYLGCLNAHMTLCTS